MSLSSGQALEVVPNIPIGLLEDYSYTMQQTTISPGHTLFLYTDGLTEARNAHQQLFGRKHTAQVVAHHSGLQGKAMVDAIISEVKQYEGATEPSDDLTLLAISYGKRQQLV